MSVIREYLKTNTIPQPITFSDDDKEVMAQYVLDSIADAGHLFPTNEVPAFAIFLFDKDRQDGADFRTIIFNIKDIFDDDWNPDELVDEIYTVIANDRDPKSIGSIIHATLSGMVSAMIPEENTLDPRSTRQCAANLLRVIHGSHPLYCVSAHENETSIFVNGSFSYDIV